LNAKPSTTSLARRASRTACLSTPTTGARATRSAAIRTKYSTTSLAATIRSPTLPSTPSWTRRRTSAVLPARGRKKQDPPIERDLMLSLEEVYHGCIKKMKISRRVMNDDGHTSSFREKILTITVKRGWLPGTRITFEQEGDQGPNCIPADIVFIVNDKPHSIFRREHANLIFTQKIPLALALTGTTIHVPTLTAGSWTFRSRDIV
ncbi:unnamed protein product, partial [Sphagnum compactum]